jgi:hypothetical protein
MNERDIFSYLWAFTVLVLLFYLCELVAQIRVNVFVSEHRPEPEFRGHTVDTGYREPIK